MASAEYIGRFAPSPTGHLHFGSLLAAMASYCDARVHNGVWRLRIDDIDPPREMQGAADAIPRSLQAYGFTWDGDIIKQSDHAPRYSNGLQQLNEAACLYLCACSRRKLDNAAIYPGYCKPTAGTLATAMEQVQHKLDTTNKSNAIRVRVDSTVTFEDMIQGEQRFEAGSHFGDTVVVRRDDLFSYALCCAIDDASGSSHVVRGADLLPTTGIQIRIMQLLGLTVPRYAHIPVALNTDHQKLSKQTFADPLNSLPVLPTLLRAWQFLGQAQLNVHSVESFWQAAIPAWQLSSVPRCMSSYQ